MKNTTKLPKGITHRGDKYRVSVMVAGQRKTATCKTLEEASETMQQMKLGLFDATSGEFDVWNLATAWEKYVDYRTVKNPASSDNGKKFTWYGKMILNHFGPAISLDDITPIQTAAFYDYLTVERNYSASAVNYLGTLLHQMQLFAVRRGRKRIAPVRMEGCRITQGRIRFLSDLEEAKVLDWYDRTGREASGDLIRFYIDTGLRKTEGLRLKFTDVDMKTGRITIWKTKNGKPRTIKMTGRVKNILERLAVGRNDFDTLVFKDHAEKRLYRDWWKMRDAIGLGDDAQFVLHMLRHTCATRLLGAGVDIRSAMEWLGHSSIEQTQRYAHFIPSKSDDAADALDRLAAEKLGGVMV
jgi:integrase